MPTYECNHAIGEQVRSIKRGEKDGNTVDLNLVRRRFCAGKIRKILPFDSCQINQSCMHFKEIIEIIFLYTVNFQSILASINDKNSKF